MEASPSTGIRRIRWSVASLMALVAALALGMALLVLLFHDPQFARAYVLYKLPQRMKRLRPGMTEKRVWKELGLESYPRPGSIGGGPQDNSWNVYSLGSGYSLQLNFDETNTPRGSLTPSFSTSVNSLSWCLSRPCRALPPLPPGFLDF